MRQLTDEEIERLAILWYMDNIEANEEDYQNIVERLRKLRDG